MRKQAIAWTASVALLAAAAVWSASPADWARVSRKDGVTVDMRGGSEGQPPTFRVRTEIRGAPLEVLAVLQDIARHCEWAPNCNEAGLIEQVTPRSRYTYARNTPGWLGSPRDVVLFTEVDVDSATGNIRSSFSARSHAKRPPRKGVVRIDHLEGYYDLRPTPSGTTAVEYLVSSDPGGNVPNWLVTERGASIPFALIRALRSRVEATRGEYESFVRAWR